jgi:DinB superfamily
MDIREFFLYLHNATHFTGKAAWTLDEAMVPHYRTVLPGHNSIAWLLWHIARGEDWAIQTILQGGEQLLIREDWGTRMGVTYPGFGGGMSREEMIALTEQIDLEALRNYYTAVAAATQAFLRTFDFAAIDAPFDVHSRLALVPEAEGPSPFFHQMFRRWTTPLVWLEVFALVDVAFHIGDTDHVLNLLVPKRDVD